MLQFHFAVTEDDLAACRTMAQRTADCLGESVLLMNCGDPQADAPARSPYCVPVSLANTFERANHIGQFEPNKPRRIT